MPIPEAAVEAAAEAAAPWLTKAVREWGVLSLVSAMLAYCLYLIVSVQMHQKDEADKYIRDTLTSTVANSTIAIEAAKTSINNNTASLNNNTAAIEAFKVMLLQREGNSK